MSEYKPGERYTVVFPRDGIAVLDGMVVFTEGSLAGEKAVVELSSVSKKHASAKIVELLTRSAERVTPVCDSFGGCGGCGLMHQSYLGQLKAKENAVLQSIKRIGKIRDFDFLPICPSPEILNYRNKTEFRLSGDRFGYFAASSHDLVPVDGCAIASPVAVKAAKRYSEAARRFGFDHGRVLTVRNNRNGEYGVIIDADRDCEAAWKTAGYIFEDDNCLGVLLRANGKNRMFGERGIYEDLCGKRFFVSHEAFFQVNTRQTENLYNTVGEFLDADGKTVLLDAYCGVGTIGIAAAGEAGSIIGIEANESAADDAGRNAELNGIRNALYIAGKCEEKYADCEKLGVNAVVCDPPRAGCGREFIEFLKRLLPEKIVYVSCDPATLARDLSLLSGKYQVDKIKPFDMFPQTKHVETVVLMSLVG